jgi:hypothetical protein
MVLRLLNSKLSKGFYMSRISTKVKCVLAVGLLFGGLAIFAFFRDGRITPTSELPSNGAASEQPPLSPDGSVMKDPITGQLSLDLSKVKWAGDGKNRTGIIHQVIEKHLANLSLSHKGEKLQQAKLIYLSSIVESNLTHEQIIENLEWFSSELGDSGWDNLSGKIGLAFCEKDFSYSKLFNEVGYEPYLSRVAKAWALTALRDDFSGAYRFISQSMPETWLKASALTALPIIASKDINSAIDLFSKSSPSPAVVEECVIKSTKTFGPENVLASILTNPKWKHQKAAVTSVLNAAALHDPNFAVQMLKQNASSVFVEPMMVGLVSGWAAQSPADASAWLNLQPPSTIRDSGVVTFIDHSYRNNPKESLAWASVISDEKKRIESLKKVFLSYKNTSPSEAEAALLNLKLSPDTLSLLGVKQKLN